MSTIIDGAKVTQIGGKDTKGGLNVLGRLFLNRVEITPHNPLITDQPAHGFPNGAPLYRDAAGFYALAIASQADGAIKGNVVGIVGNASLNEFTLVTIGPVTISGLIDGSQYYVSSTVAGNRVTVAPSSPSFVAPILVAISSTEGLVNIQLSLVGA